MNQHKITAPIGTAYDGRQLEFLEQRKSNPPTQPISRLSSLSLPLCSLQQTPGQFKGKLHKPHSFAIDLLLNFVTRREGMRTYRPYQLCKT
jgi:hypothetical protein